MSLPESFTEIRPTAEAKSEPPQNARVRSNCFNHSSIKHECDSWLEILGTNPEGDIKTHFAAFYSAIAEQPTKCSSHLLPLIPEPVTAPATVRHAVNIIHKIIEKVNPNQKVVITGDQPVYALGKQLKWRFPTEFDDTIWMLGPLHIEEMFLKLIGNWLEKSVWP